MFSEPRHLEIKNWISTSTRQQRCHRAGTVNRSRSFRPRARPNRRGQLGADLTARLLETRVKTTKSPLRNGRPRIFDCWLHRIYLATACILELLDVIKTSKTEKMILEEKRAPVFEKGLSSHDESVRDLNSRHDGPSEEEARTMREAACTNESTGDRQWTCVNASNENMNCQKRDETA